MVVAVLALVGGPASALSARAAAPLELFYRVSHSVVGNVGWYSCTVEPLVNGATQINAREHIDVRMLGIPVYRLDATNTERWAGNRLISFDAVSDKAGGRVEISGEAKGDHFIITSPQGTLTAAATVHPAEPCAANFLQLTTVLRPDTGNLEAVRVSGGAPETLTIEGTATAVRKYVIDGKTRYTVWLDSRNLPVRFVVDDDTGEATFTLARCVSCNPQISRLGSE